MHWKILVTSRAFMEVGLEAQQLLVRAGCELVDRTEKRPLEETALEAEIDGVDAVVASVERYGRRLFESPRSRRLKLISRWGVGYDAIDVPEATRAGVAVAYVPGLLSETVADFAFAMMLASARRLLEGARRLSIQGWGPAWGSNVHGKTLGLIGCGRIGQAMARRAKGFDMRLLGYDVAPSASAGDLGVHFVSLNELLAQSDFVSIHAALSGGNHRLIGEPELRQMRSTAYLINTARGALVDEEALNRVLRQGGIAGAALDVFAVEPLAPGHPLRSAPNVLLSPHQASFTRETGEQLSRRAALAIIDLIEGRRPADLVNPEVFEASTFRSKTCQNVTS